MSDLRFRLGGRGLRGLRMRLSSRATGASHEGAAGGKGGGRAASVSHVRRKLWMQQDQHEPQSHSNSHSRGLNFINPKLLHNPHDAMATHKTRNFKTANPKA